VISSISYFLAHTGTTGFTASGDGTSDRHINYESQHIAYKNPRANSSNRLASRVIRLFGVASSVDHASETQIGGWKAQFSALRKLYNSSMLAYRYQTSLFSAEFSRKLKGMNGDHAADQKKTFALMRGYEGNSPLMGVPATIRCLRYLFLNSSLHKSS
jgi:hypothetical protein